MCYLEPVEPKEFMKKKKYRDVYHYAGTATCGRCMESCFGAGRAQDDATRDALYGDAAFANIATIEKLTENHRTEFVGPIKGNNKGGLPYAWLQTKMANWAAGAVLVLKCINADVPFYVIGYKYKFKSVQVFVCSERVADFSPGGAYVSRYRDRETGNTMYRPVARPRVLSNYFAKSGLLDEHNHLRQGELGIERFWRTTNGQYKIYQTLLGMTVVDCYRAVLRSGPERMQELDLRSFVNHLVQGILHPQSWLGRDWDVCRVDGNGVSTTVSPRGGVEAGLRGFHDERGLEEDGIPMDINVGSEGPVDSPIHNGMLSVDGSAGMPAHASRSTAHSQTTQSTASPLPRAQIPLGLQHIPSEFWNLHRMKLVDSFIKRGEATRDDKLRRKRSPCSEEDCRRHAQTFKSALHTTSNLCEGCGAFVCGVSKSDRQCFAAHVARQYLKSLQGESSLSTQSQRTMSILQTQVWLENRAVGLGLRSSAVNADQQDCSMGELSTTEHSITEHTSMSSMPPHEDEQEVPPHEDEQEEEGFFDYNV